MEQKLRILIVDDNERTLEAICLELADRSEVTATTSADDAMDFITNRSFDVVLADYDLGSGVTGLHIFRRAQRKNPYLTACLMTGNNASALMKEIFDTFSGFLIEKPFKEGAFDELLKRGRINVLRRLENESHLSDQQSFPGLVAETPSIIRLIDQLKRCSKDIALSIHMTGPTGTGKSTFAEIIHRLSGVRGRFVTVHCAGLEELALSRLFGHVKGAFTGATKDHEGYIKEADGGTLFLDEFHLLSLEVQGKLLRVLQDGKYRRLGDVVDRESKFRLITAASVDVRTMAESKKFSPDLWYRVSGKVLEVPGLSERKACIPKLVYRRLAELSRKANQSYEIDPDALDLISAFSWDGNIRDLYNCLQSVCSELLPGQRITAEMVREDLRHRSGSFGAVPVKLTSGESLKDACRRFEVSLISQAMLTHQGNVLRAAKALGIPRGTLRSRCEALGLKVAHGKKSEVRSVTSS